MEDTLLWFKSYIGDTNGVVEHLKKKGIKTKEQAINELRAAGLGGTVMGVLASGKGSLAGMSNTVQAIEKEFSKKKKK